jgi:hypothetical protein
MKQDMRLYVIAIALSSVAACGGGGGTSQNPVVVATAAPQASSQPNASGKLTIVVPTRQEGPSARKFITPAVAGVSIQVSGGGGSWSNFYAITASAPYCSGAPLACTLGFNAFAGTDTIAVTTYDQATPGGYATSSGTTTTTIAAGSANNVTITTEGIVGQIAFAFSNPYPATGSAQTINLEYAGADADDYVVTGTYAYPIKFSDSDTSGVTTTPANATASGQTLTVQYSGGTLASPATYGGATTAPAFFLAGVSSNPTITPGGNGPIPSPALLTFTSPTAGAQTIAISSAGTSTPPYSVIPYSCGGAINAVSTGLNTYTIAPTGTAAFCAIEVMDSESNTTQVPVVIQP